MSDTNEDLQATAENVALDAQVLERIEEEKLRTDPADPKMQELSDKAVAIAKDLHAKTIAQRDLAAEAADEASAAS